MVTQRRLEVAAIVLVVASAAILLLWVSNSSGEHPCVPDARGTFHQFDSRGLVLPEWESERGASGTDADDCSGQSAFSIRPDGENSLGLTMSYERFGAAWNHTGASVASQRLADQRPPDAAEFDLSDESYGDEGYLDAAMLEGQSRVDLVIRDRNVLVRVTYRADQSLSRATMTAEQVGRYMLEQLNDYRSN